MLIFIGIILAVIIFIAYWTIMFTLAILAAIFYFWVLVIAVISGDPYVGWVGAIFATGLTFWLMDLANNKKQ